jgi:hypothetical protein
MGCGGRQGRVGVENLRQCVDRPTGEVDLRVGEEPGAGVDGHRRGDGQVPAAPADRAEEADGVVLDTEPLPVVGHEFLALARHAGASGRRGGPVQKGRDPGAQHGRVLPGDGRPEPGRRGDRLQLPGDGDRGVVERGGELVPFGSGHVGVGDELVGGQCQARRCQPQDAVGGEAGAAEREVLP